jgi:hypothetical protein
MMKATSIRAKPQITIVIISALKITITMDPSKPTIGAANGSMTVIIANKRIHSNFNPRILTIRTLYIFGKINKTQITQY